MNKEKLIARILKECAEDGESITREEAEEMAEMEIRSNAMRRYEKSDAPRKPALRKHEPDIVKLELMSTIAQNIDRAYWDYEYKVGQVRLVNPEREITFTVGDDEYSVVLIKHRKKKTS